MNKKLLLLTLLVLFTGCGKNIPTLQERKTTAFSLSQEQNLQEKIYQTTNFNLFSYQTHLRQCKNIKVFIEGDGLAWITRSIVSKDPTPLNPTGLKLMLKDSSKCKLYLARPCQYIDSSMCEKKYWTSHRFNIKVIESYLQVLDEIKRENQNKSFTLVGYSGGGAIAAILSAKRKDIQNFITIVGNLDTHKWTAIHSISPLNGSLNPADFTKDLQNLPQVHYVGKNDKIIPLEIFQSYKSKFTNDSNIKLIMIDATHIKGVLEFKY